MAGRHIPEIIKRQVRRECAFGCVICGIPIWEYDHIEEFSSVHRHEPENLVLLCPSHHAEKTKGNITQRRLIEARLNPFNKSRVMSNKWRPVTAESDNFQFNIGDLSFEHNTMDLREISIAVIDGLQSIGYMRDGQDILINLNLFGKRGNPIMVIRNGELEINTTNFEFNRVGSVINAADGDGTSIEIEYRPSILSIRRGTLNGALGTILRVEKEGVSISNSNTGLYKIIESQSHFNRTLAISPRDFEFASFVRQGTLESAVLDDSLEMHLDLRGRISPLEEKYRELKSIQKLMWQSPRFMSARRLSLYDRYLSEVIRIHSELKHPDDRRMLYGGGLIKQWLASSIGDSDMMASSCFLFARACRAPCPDYLDSESAQLGVNFTNSIFFCFQLKGSWSPDWISLVKPFMEIAERFYAAQDSKFMDGRYAGTREVLLEAKSRLAMLSQFGTH